jgi:hypothetical protein
MMSPFFGLVLVIHLMVIAVGNFARLIHPYPSANSFRWKDDSSNKPSSRIVSVSIVLLVASVVLFIATSILVNRIKESDNIKSLNTAVESPIFQTYKNRLSSSRERAEKLQSLANSA